MYDSNFISLAVCHFRLDQEQLPVDVLAIKRPCKDSPHWQLVSPTPYHSSNAAPISLEVMDTCAPCSILITFSDFSSVKFCSDVEPTERDQSRTWEADISGGVKCWRD